MRKFILGIIIFSFFLSNYADEMKTEQSSPSPSLILYQKPDFSFGLNIPQRKMPTTASGFEQLRSYDHLKDRLESNNSFSNKSDNSFTDLFQQINALNLQFKLKF